MANATENFDDVPRAEGTYPRGFPVDVESLCETFNTRDEETKSILFKVAEGLSFIPKRLQWVYFFVELGILSENPFSFNTSQMGAGKTFMEVMMACYLKEYARRHGKRFNLYVIAPDAAHHTWAALCEQNGLPITYIDTFNGLALVRDSPRITTVLKHGYLTVSPIVKPGREEEEGEKTRYMYDASDLWSNKCKNEVCFVIIDECQSVKNFGSTFNAAVSAFCLPITGVSGHLSRVVFSSATPFDSKEAYVSYFRAIGAVHKNPTLFTDIDNLQKTYTRTGITEIFNFCGKIDAGFTFARDTPAVAPGHYVETLKELFTECIVKNYFMGVDAEIPRELYELYNGYFALSPDKAAQFNAILAELSEVMYGNKQDAALGKASRGSVGKFTHYFQALQSLKVDVMKEIGEKVLRSNRNAKLILAVNYKADQEELRRYFSRYGEVLIINGDARQKNDRPETVEKFQRPNTDYRVLVLTTASGGVALSLHDTDGRFPRTMLVVPDYGLIKNVQAAGRVVRTGLMSKAEVINIYIDDRGLKLKNAEGVTTEGMRVVDSFTGKEGYCQEVSLVSALNRKSNDAKTALTQNIGEEDTGLILPGDFKTVIN